MDRALSAIFCPRLGELSTNHLFFDNTPYGAMILATRLVARVPIQCQKCTKKSSERISHHSYPLLHTRPEKNNRTNSAITAAWVNALSKYRTESNYWSKRSYSQWWSRTTLTDVSVAPSSLRPTWFICQTLLQLFFSSDKMTAKFLPFFVPKKRQTLLWLSSTKYPGQYAWATNSGNLDQKEHRRICTKYGAESKNPSTKNSRTKARRGMRRVAKIHCRFI